MHLKNTAHYQLLLKKIYILNNSETYISQISINIFTFVCYRSPIDIADKDKVHKRKTSDTSELLGNVAIGKHASTLWLRYQYYVHNYISVTDQANIFHRDGTDTKLDVTFL